MKDMVIERINGFEFRIYVDMMARIQMCKWAMNQDTVAKATYEVNDKETIYLMMSPRNSPEEESVFFIDFKEELKVCLRNLGKLSKEDIESSTFADQIKESRISSMEVEFNDPEIKETPNGESELRKE